jgi:UDP-3-O-[3-hydroxymyristoyl] glucosamine N-acyltransferase
MPASLGELATEFGCELAGDPEVRVGRVATLVNASPESVGFLASSAYRNELLSTKAAAVVLTEADAGECPVAALISDDPYATYALIAGSATVGKRCMIAGLAGVAGHVTVCDDVAITAQALITKDIHEPGVYSATFGAEKDKDWKRMVVRFRRSEALEKRVAELEAKVNKNDG